MFKKFFITLTIFTLLLTLAAAGGGAFAYYYFVIANPGPEIQQHNIKKILAIESPVLYRDGQTKIGVFFQEAHRQYLSFEEIPKDFINAIVAAEDNTFFTHRGIDFAGISRALISNIKAGRVVQGGSTITQQTAKNLFKRKDRSIVSKMKELLYALRLEHHYPKEKILEFYCNQFYVSGNGHGLGVAAQFYFNKKVGELDLLECAFIAGSVKRPNAYNVFIQKTEEQTAQARQLARDRATYVLKQMHKLGMIDSQRYQESLTRDISFIKGKTFFSLNTLMDQVKEALSSTEIEDALALHGIDNVSTSGIRIITTVDKNLQDKGLYALRKELSLLDVRLRGYDPDRISTAYAKFSSDPLSNQQIMPGMFVFGEISEIDHDNRIVKILFRNGEKIVGTGRIDRTGLMPLVDSLIKWKQQRWSEATDRDLLEFLGQIRKGNTVFVSIREYDPLADEMVLDLEKYPEIQGGLLVMQSGRVRAMIGGMENHYYNRAVTAKRSMGSVIKPLVYAAAMQLGWNNTDPLNNERDIFLYQNQAYFPRPDHVSPHRKVSMNWAGVHSENVATVWLLHNLTNHLTPGQFRKIAEYLGMSSRVDESYHQYAERLRDRYGIVVNERTLFIAAFHKAVTAMEPDLIFAGMSEELDFLKKLHYGANFATFFTELEELRGRGYNETQARKIRAEEEIDLRTEILNRNYLRFRQMADDVRGLTYDLPFSADREPSGNLYLNWATGHYVYAASRPENGNWEMFDLSAARALIAGMSVEEANRFIGSIRIENTLSVATIDTLTEYMKQEYKELSSLPPYSFEVLQHVTDFRIMTGLRYMVGLSRALGIQSNLDPVLSFPLGSNVISLFEAARAYEGLITGKVTVFKDEKTAEGLAIIDRIEDSDGTLIYSPERIDRPVLSTATALATGNILRNVVQYGTGRFADKNIRLHSTEATVEKQLNQLDLRIPVMGKTGTANQFTNAAFLGMVPNVSADAKGMTVENGYVIASYVGFDDNTPMERNNTHISGSSGALPTWTRMANDVLLEMNYGEKFDLIDMVFTASTSPNPAIPLAAPDLGQIEIAVNQGNGLPSPGETSKAATVLTFGTINENGELVPARTFAPYWEQGGQTRLPAY